MIKTRLSDCSLITLPRHSERSGSLTAVESDKPIPFDIARVFYLYDIPEENLEVVMLIMNAINYSLPQAVPLM
jgi:hypothetical protein